MIDVETTLRDCLEHRAGVVPPDVALMGPVAVRGRQNTARRRVYVGVAVAAVAAMVAIPAGILASSPGPDRVVTPAGQRSPKKAAPPKTVPQSLRFPYRYDREVIGIENRGAARITIVTSRGALEVHDRGDANPVEAGYFTSEEIGSYWPSPTATPITMSGRPAYLIRSAGTLWAFAWQPVAGRWLVAVDPKDGSQLGEAEFRGAAPAFTSGHTDYTSRIRFASIPEGYEIVSVTSSTVTLAPPGDRDRNSDIVAREAGADTFHKTGKRITVGGRNAWLTTDRVDQWEIYVRFPPPLMYLQVTVDGAGRLNRAAFLDMVAGMTLTP